MGLGWLAERKSLDGALCNLSPSISQSLGPKIGSKNKTTRRYNRAYHRYAIPLLSELRLSHGPIGVGKVRQIFPSPLSSVVNRPSHIKRLIDAKALGQVYNPTIHDGTRNRRYSYAIDLTGVPCLIHALPITIPIGGNIRAIIRSGNKW